MIAEWQKQLSRLSKERRGFLKDKAFWITGAGTGYGRCLAVTLAAAGAKVFLTGRRKSKLEEALDEMKSLGIDISNCYAVTADITDFDQVSEACKKVIGLTDSLCGLINNAALPSKGETKQPLLEGSIDEWERIMATNLTAPWFLTRTIFPHMAKGNIARVLFISSQAGWAFTPGLGPYNISKAALNSLSMNMAEECVLNYSKTDVQINTLIAGEALTEMNLGSKESPYKIVPMAIALLSHPKGGPNGKFFYWDGRCGSFCNASPYKTAVL